MANVTQLKHLEHIEDEMLNYGVEGCKSIVSFLKELRKMLGCDNSTGYMQTKWDGLPSVICGIDPGTEEFFVGTKSVFNKTEPKLAASDNGVEMFYGTGDLADKLKLCLKYFSQLGIKGVVQGDLMFAPGDVSDFTDANGKKSHKFGLNTITYSIPKDHPLGKEVSNSKIGIVFHTHYNNKQPSHLADLQAIAGAGENLKSSQNVMVIDNDTPYHNVGLTKQEAKEFDKTVASIKKECGFCGDFLDELVLKGGGQGNPKGEDKYHIAPYLKKYFNHEISKDKVTTRVDDTMQGLLNFYYHAMEKDIVSKKQPATVSQKLQLIKSSLEYLMNNEAKFKSLIELYRLIQNLKQQIIDKLDHLETFGTYVLKDNAYKVTTPEGYVLHREGSMVKLVNRLEFSKNNFLGGSFQVKKAKPLPLVYATYSGYPGKKCVVSFGRFQPPTKGHLANLDECKALAKQWGADDYRLFISQKHQSDANYKDKQGTDPLPPDRKLFWMNKMFGQKHPGKIVSGHREIKHNLADLMMDGFRHIIFLAGDEDKKKWDRYLPRYNGTPPWDYTFFTFEIRSSGERSKAVSGTKQRIAAVNAVMTPKPNKHYANFKANIGSMLNKNELDSFIVELQKFIPVGYDGK